jgi:hypothetical protein
MRESTKEARIPIELDKYQAIALTTIRIIAVITEA